MKKTGIFILLVVLPLSCGSLRKFGLFTEKINLKLLITEKEEIDRSNNPAKKLLLLEELKEKEVILKNITVDDIVPSQNIDYDFSVVASVQSDKGKIRCIIYTKNVKIISELEKGKTKIDVHGRFSRFFSLLDDFYTTVEIIQSKIEIIEKEEK
jgi:hypothetical protein